MDLANPTPYMSADAFGRFRGEGPTTPHFVSSATTHLKYYTSNRYYIIQHKSYVLLHRLN